MALTWACHICKRERPDQFISMMKHDLMVYGQKLGEQIVHHCNDNPGCIEGARTYRHVPDKLPTQVMAKAKFIEEGRSIIVVDCPYCRLSHLHLPSADNGSPKRANCGGVYLLDFSTVPGSENV